MKERTLHTHPEGDYYECINGIRVTYTGTYLINGYWMKQYDTTGKNCTECPIKDECFAYKATQKRVIIKETVEKPFYDRMHVRMETRRAKRLMKLRQSTVEPVIGTLVNYLGIKRVNVKGLDQANKCLTLAAVAYNLKKMLKHKSGTVEKAVKRCFKDLKLLLQAQYLHLTVYY